MTSARPALVTPLGTLRTWFACAELDAANVFGDPAADVELRMGDIQASIPEHMTLSGCRAALWRVTARRHLSMLRFHGEWPEPPREAEGGPNPGEGLDAFTWYLGGAALSLGTEDGELLSARAMGGAGMPARLAGELSYSTVRYTDSGLIVPLSELHPGETVEVHFIVAWTDARVEDVPATWFAVDQDHARVVRSLAGG